MRRLDSHHSFRVNGHSRRWLLDSPAQSLFRGQASSVWPVLRLAPWWAFSSFYPFGAHVPSRWPD